MPCDAHTNNKDRRLIFSLVGLSVRKWHWCFSFAPIFSPFYLTSSCDCDQTHSQTSTHTDTHTSNSLLNCVRTSIRARIILINCKKQCVHKLKTAMTMKTTILIWGCVSFNDKNVSLINVSLVGWLVGWSNCTSSKNLIPKWALSTVVFLATFQIHFVFVFVTGIFFLWTPKTT